MAINRKKQVNRRERIGGLIYIGVIFIIGIGLSGWLVFSESEISQAFAKKDGINIKMKRQQSFKKDQNDHSTICDFITERIINYNPGVNAVFEKNEIQYLIADLRKKYENNRNDKRYMVFLHLSNFYEMWFNDRQLLSVLNSNMEYLKQNLAECELGLEKKKGSINGGK